MKSYKVVLESSYYGADEEFEFEAPDNATEEELEEEALDILLMNINWHYELIESKEREV